MRRELMFFIRFINKTSGCSKLGSLREEGRDPHAYISHEEEYNRGQVTVVLLHLTTHHTLAPVTSVKGSNRNRISGGPGSQWRAPHVCR